MFTDIVNSTQIKAMMAGETSARRDANFRRLVKEPHDAVVLTCVQQAGGYVVNPTGDGFCVAFIDAEEAVLCALRIQHHLTAHPVETPQGPLQIRIGLHTGVANPSGDDYIASTVDKAARIQSQAGGGEVFVSQQTQVLVFDRTHGIRFESRGVFDLKGLQAEQLYQATPTPELELPPVTAHDVASSAQNAGLRPARRKVPRVVEVGAVLALCVTIIGSSAFLLAGNGGSQAEPSAETVDAALGQTPKAKLEAGSENSPLLPAGSQWDGNFHFLPPMAHYDGSVSIHVDERHGEKFAGTYSSEDDKYRWLIEGTVRGNRVRWDFIKVIKKSGAEDAVGKAYGEATIEGDQMQGFYRNRDEEDETAKLDLRATP